MALRFDDQEERMKRKHDPTIRACFHSGGLEEFSCGKMAAKKKGSRAIVISAITEEGVVLGCTKVIISDRGSVRRSHRFIKRVWRSDRFSRKKNFSYDSII
ncbi:hypothetical protein Aduo_005056 [Ancylostoma duodenale]